MLHVNYSALKTATECFFASPRGNRPKGRVCHCTVSSTCPPEVSKWVVYRFRSKAELYNSWLFNSAGKLFSDETTAWICHDHDPMFNVSFSTELTECWCLTMHSELVSPGERVFAYVLVNIFYCKICLMITDCVYPEHVITLSLFKSFIHRGLFQSLGKSLWSPGNLNHCTPPMLKLCGGCLAQIYHRQMFLLFHFFWARGVLFYSLKHTKLLNY